MKERRKMPIWQKILIGIGSFVILLMMVFGVYVSIFYHAGTTAKELVKGNDMVQAKEVKNGLLLDGPGEDSAIIFYPGAKVEYIAYVPVFMEVASNGVDVFLVDMPFHLAFFGLNKASDIYEEYSYEHWYLSGHSLGGAMAANYASKHMEEYDGLILLASYSVDPLESEQFRVLSLYGSEDQVLAMDKVKEGREKIAGEYKEVCLEGGNHAWFGDYGKQKGDGEATISHEKQWQQAAEEIMKFMTSRSE